MPQRSMWQNHQVSGLLTQRQQPRSSGLALGNPARTPTSWRKMWSRRGEGWLYGRSHNSVRKPQGPTVTGSQAAQQGPGEESTQCRKCWRLRIQFPRTVAPHPPRSSQGRGGVGGRDHGHLSHQTSTKALSSGQPRSPRGTWSSFLGRQPPVTPPHPDAGSPGKAGRFLRTQGHTVCPRNTDFGVTAPTPLGHTMGQGSHRNTQEVLLGLPWSPQMPSLLGPQVKHCLFILVSNMDNHSSLLRNGMR